MKLRQFVIAALAVGSAGAMAAANDTSSNLSTSSSQSYTASLPNDNSQVSQIQQALNAKGYDVGSVDGKMGAKTKTALKQFQQAQGLQASGKADQQTLAALTIKGTDSGPSSSENTTSTPSTSPSTSSNGGFSPQTPANTSVQPNSSMSSSPNGNGASSPNSPSSSDTSGTNGSTQPKKPS